MRRFSFVILLMLTLAVPISAAVEDFNEGFIIQESKVIKHSDVATFGLDQEGGGWIFTSDGAGFVVVPSGGPDGSAYIGRDTSEGTAFQWARGFAYIVKNDKALKGIQTLEFDLLYTSNPGQTEPDITVRVIGVNPAAPGGPFAGEWIGNGGSGGSGADHAARYRTIGAGGGNEMAADGTLIRKVRDTEIEVDDAGWQHFVLDDLDFGDGYEWIFINIANSFRVTSVPDPQTKFGVDNVSFPTILPKSLVEPIDPEDEAINVSPETTLQWDMVATNESAVGSYILYMDPNENNVKDPTGQDLMVDGVVVNPTDPLPTIVTEIQADRSASYAVTGIQDDTTYYWRVDVNKYEIEQNQFVGPELVEGPVWSFTGLSTVPEILVQPANEYVCPFDPDSHTPVADAAASFTAQCRVAKPLLSAEWFKDGSETPLSGPRYTTEFVAIPDTDYDFQAILTIADVTVADMGEYVCKVTVDTLAQASVETVPANLFVSDTVLAHRYSFTADASDSVGSADGVVIDGGATTNITFEDGQVVFGGEISAELGNEASDDPNSHFIDLPNGIVSALGNHATFMVWYTRSEAHGSNSWSRLLDFGIPATDATYPTPESLEGISKGGNGGANYVILTGSPQRFQAHLGGTATGESLAGTGQVEADIEFCMAGVYNDGAVTLYALSTDVDGNVVIEVAESSSDLELAQLIDLNNWIGRSQWQDALFNGKVNEVRIYGIPLSQAWVKALYKDGPDGDALNADPCLIISPYDLNDDCLVNIIDLQELVNSWLDCGLFDCN